jgi:hypothetical protein
MSKQEGDRRFAGQLRRLLPVLLDPGHVDVGNEIVGVGAPEHEHLDGGIGLGSLNERDQIADQFGAQKIHGRGGNFREQNGAFSAHGERLGIVGHGPFFRVPLWSRRRWAASSFSDPFRLAQTDKD